MKKISSKKLSFKRIKVEQLAKSSGGTGSYYEGCYGGGGNQYEQFEGGGGSGSGGYGDPAEQDQDSTNAPGSTIPNECLECRVTRKNADTASGG